MTKFQESIEAAKDTMNEKYPGAPRVEELLEEFSKDFGKQKSAKEFEKRCLELSEKLQLSPEEVEDIYGQSAVMLVQNPNNRDKVKALNRAYGKIIDKNK